MRLLAIVVCVVLSIGFGYSLEVVKRINYEFGDRVPGDELVHETSITKNPADKWFVFQEDTYAHFKYSQKKEDSPFVITYMELIDKHKSITTAREAEVEMAKGGVGKTYVDLAFGSLKGYGFNYNIKIYGKRKENKHRQVTAHKAEDKFQKKKEIHDDDDDDDDF